MAWHGMACYDMVVVEAIPATNPEIRFHKGQMIAVKGEAGGALFWDRSKIP